MKSFNELMQELVNTDYEELVSLAQRAMVDLMPVCESVDPDNKGVLMMTSLILAAVGADGVLTKLERKMLSDVLGLESSTIDRMIGMYDSRMVDLADHFADNLGDTVKSQAVLLISAFAAVDEKINKDEIRLINKLMT